MATHCELNAEPVRNRVAAFQFAHWRTAALVALLIAEGLAFTLRFDTASLEAIDAPWARLLGQTWLLGRFALSAAAAMLVFSGPALTARWRAAPSAGSSGLATVWALVVHGVALALFYRFTVLLFEGPGASFLHGPGGAIVWATAGLVAVASWAAAVLPISTWARIASSAGRFIVWGLLVATVALAAGQFAGQFWALLCGPTIACVEAILRLFYADVIVRPEELLVQVNSYAVTIDPECSGFEGLGLIVVFVGGFLWCFRDRLLFPQALALIPLGMAAIWLSNAVRLALLIAIGASYSAEVANGGFHSQAGWLAFNLVALAVVYLAWNSALFHRPPAQSAGQEAEFQYVAGPYLLPLLMLLATMMLTAAFSTGSFDYLYPIRVAATIAVLAFYWKTYRSRGYLSWTWAWSPLLIGVAVFVIWRALEPVSATAAATNAETSRALADLSPLAAGLWLLFRALGSIVTVPLAEELAFRGYLTRQLVAEDFQGVPLSKFTWFSFLLSSAIFGALHGRWIAGVIAGMLFALALYRRGRLLDAVIAHATANALITLYVLYFRDWSAWS